MNLIARGLRSFGQILVGVPDRRRAGTLCGDGCGRDPGPGPSPPPGPGVCCSPVDDGRSPGCQHRPRRQTLSPRFRANSQTRSSSNILMALPRKIL